MEEDNFLRWDAMGKMALGRVSSEDFGFLCQFSSHQLLHIRYSSYHFSLCRAEINVAVNPLKSKILLNNL
jgi:hypothetical protein